MDRKLICFRYCHEQKDGDKFLEEALKHGIPRESLPSYLGGSHPGRPMNNTFRPSVADTPHPVAVPTARTNEEPVPLSPTASS